MSDLVEEQGPSCHGMMTWEVIRLEWAPRILHPPRQTHYHQIHLGCSDPHPLVYRGRMRGSGVELDSSLQLVVAMQALPLTFSMDSCPPLGVMFRFV